MSKRTLNYIRRWPRPKDLLSLARMSAPIVIQMELCDLIQARCGSDWTIALRSARVNSHLAPYLTILRIIKRDKVFHQSRESTLMMKLNQSMRIFPRLEQWNLSA